MKCFTARQQQQQSDAKSKANNTFHLQTREPFFNLIVEKVSQNLFDFGSKTKRIEWTFLNPNKLSRLNQ